MADSSRGAPYQLGRYVVVSELGRGGMASVHLARADGPGGFLRWCAIKQIHPELVEQSDVVDMFLDEARMAARITHPNVAQIYELGRSQDTYWLVMEYLHGEPLRELVRYHDAVGAPIPWHLAARIVADAAEGLHAAHEVRDEAGKLMGLVHRDVTPHNIFVTYDGQVKLCDFGIAKAEGRLAHTGHGQLKGKLAYMSPEQAWEREIDRRSDVYALGIVLWELLTNRRLFARETDVDSFIAVREGQVPRPTEIVPGIPEKLEKIALRALYRNRDRRYQTARELSYALQRFLRKTFGTVGTDEVSAYFREVFAEREANRLAYLDQAAEVSARFTVSMFEESGASEMPTAPTALAAPKRKEEVSTTDEMEMATIVMVPPFDSPVEQQGTALPFREVSEPRVVLRDLEAGRGKKRVVLPPRADRHERAAPTVRRIEIDRAARTSKESTTGRVTLGLALLGVLALAGALWLAVDAFR